MVRTSLLSQYSTFPVQTTVSSIVVGAALYTETKGTDCMTALPEKRIPAIIITVAIASAIYFFISPSPYLRFIIR